MSHDIPGDLLDRYLTGDCTSSERARMEAWIAAAPDRAARIDRLRASVGGPRLSRDVDRAWDRLHTRITQAPDAQHTTKTRLPRPFTRADRLWKDGRPAAWKVAAAIALLVVGTAVTRKLLSIDAGTTVASDWVTRAGERDTVDLPDDTRVVLGPNSRLHVEESFGDATRDVRLEGEAFFDVTSDSSRPFRVAAGPARVAVLGTEFAVTAFGDSVTVAVREGRVAVGRDQSSADLVLAAGQIGRMRRTGTAERIDGRADAWLAWIDGALDFESATLADVATRLESWFGVRIRIADPVLAARTITGRFRATSISDVLDALTLTIDAGWTQLQDEYVIRPPETERRTR